MGTHQFQTLARLRRPARPPPPPPPPPLFRPQTHTHTHLSTTRTRTPPCNSTNFLSPIYWCAQRPGLLCQPIFHACVHSMHWGRTTASEGELTAYGIKQKHALKGPTQPQTQATRMPEQGEACGLAGSTRTQAFQRMHMHVSI
jgi:hypothetical protein